MASSSIFIDDMGTNKVDKLIDKQRKLGKEIEYIQSSCNHKNKVISMIHEGSFHSVRWVCSDCSKVLDWPTDYEIQKFLGKKA
tara:strand:- start:120 stop:368 length:249 start_codon:yes stop_codon:yes gene_type:complete